MTWKWKLVVAQLVYTKIKNHRIPTKSSQFTCNKHIFCSRLGQRQKPPWPLCELSQKIHYCWNFSRHKWGKNEIILNIIYRIINRKIHKKFPVFRKTCNMNSFSFVQPIQIIDDPFSSCIVETVLFLIVWHFNHAFGQIFFIEFQFHKNLQYWFTLVGAGIEINMP